MLSAQTQSPQDLGEE
uniref:Uncharacterized protein n=1 Tax=Arundo donax TaxID=35708 RepID=A0A0A8XU77_ARUDO